MRGEAVEKHRLRFSIRSLMIAVVVCALLLTLIGWVGRQKAPNDHRKLGEPPGGFAAMLEARARVAYLARVRAEGTASSTATALPATGLPAADSPHWAALTVNHAVFSQGATNDLMLEFTLINDSAEVLDPKITDSRLIINGKELTDSAVILRNVPRARFDPLPPGGKVQFGCALGKYFAKPGVYLVSWNGTNFRSPLVAFQVLPDTPH